MEHYLDDVSRLADDVLSAGEAPGPILETYGDFADVLSEEPRRTRPELLAEALLVGVLWRARGNEATDSLPAPARHSAQNVQQRKPISSKASSGGKTEPLRLKYSVSDSP